MTRIKFIQLLFFVDIVENMNIQFSDFTTKIGVALIILTGASNFFLPLHTELLETPLNINATAKYDLSNKPRCDSHISVNNSRTL